MGIGLTILLCILGAALLGGCIFVLKKALPKASIAQRLLAVPGFLLFGGSGVFCLLGAGQSAYDYLLADDATLLGIAEGSRPAGWIRESGRGNSAWLDAATILLGRGDQNLANSAIGHRSIACVSNDLREKQSLSENGKRSLEILRRFPKEKLMELIYTDLERTHDGDNTFVLVGKLAVPGMEEVLVRALNDYGTKKMAEDLLNSGSRRLYDVAVQWCQERGYPVGQGYGSNRFTWRD